jgi:hypothetical protein
MKNGGRGERGEKREERKVKRGWDGRGVEERTEK